MKISFLLFIVASFNVYSRPIEYNCNCIDFGTECDGGEKIILSLNAEDAQIKLTDKVGGSPTTIITSIDKNYISNTNNEYLRFKNNNKTSSFPSFLIQKSMLKESKNGKVEMSEVSETNTNYVWNFYCIENKN